MALWTYGAVCIVLLVWVAMQCKSCHVGKMTFLPFVWAYMPQLQIQCTLTPHQHLRITEIHTIMAGVCTCQEEKGKSFQLEQLCLLLCCYSSLKKTSPKMVDIDCHQIHCLICSSDCPRLEQCALKSRKASLISLFCVCQNTEARSSLFSLTMVFVTIEGYKVIQKAIGCLGHSTQQDQEPVLSYTTGSPKRWLPT